MITFDVMKHSELKECAALAASSFYQYDYFSIWFPEEKRRLPSTVNRAKPLERLIIWRFCLVF